MIDDATKQGALTRLKKVEGQVRGLMRMVAEGKYCIDLIDQVNATRRALEGIALIIMKRHVESCVTESARRKGGDDKIGELISTIDRFIR